MHDRDEARAEPCVAEGATASADFSGCEIVALAVPDDARSRRWWAGCSGDALVVVHSTILPGTARRLAAGRPLLDAPVSGGPDRALEGDLTVMVGGEAGGRRARAAGARRGRLRRPPRRPVGRRARRSSSPTS